MEPHFYGAERELGDLADLIMAEALEIEHGQHGSIRFGQAPDTCSDKGREIPLLEFQVLIRQRTRDCQVVSMLVVKIHGRQLLILPCKPGQADVVDDAIEPCSKF